MHTNIQVENGLAQKPEITKFYNATRGAVDTLDEMVGSAAMTSLALFGNMLDISACNAMVIFLHIQPQCKSAEKKNRHRFFLIGVGKSPSHMFIARGKNMPHGNRSRDMLCD